MEKSKMEKRDKEKLADLLDRLSQLQLDTEVFLMDFRHFKSWYADTSELNAKDEEYLVQMIADIKGSEAGLVRAQKNGMLLFLDLL